MSTEKLGADIESYLNGTLKIKDYSASKKLISYIEGRSGDEEYQVVPWDIHQIALNVRAGDVDEVRQFFRSRGETFGIISDAKGVEKVKLKDEKAFSNSDGKSSNRKPAGTVTVLDAFKWYLYHKVDLLSENGSKTVGISDGVFAIKNELFLPDDFVPPVMMKMVEGSEIVDITKAVENIQPSGQSSALYMFGKHDGGDFLEPDSFYANPCINGEVPVGMENLGKRILESFTELQNTDNYRKFLLSRIMRNVIFTVETKKKRELKKPMFDMGKLKILEASGIVEISGDTGTVPESITAEDLKNIKAQAEKDAANVSDDWMKSTMDLPA